MLKNKIEKMLIILIIIKIAFTRYQPNIYPINFCRMSEIDFSCRDVKYKYLCDLNLCSEDKMACRYYLEIQTIMRIAMKSEIKAKKFQLFNELMPKCETDKERDFKKICKRKGNNENQNKEYFSCDSNSYICGKNYCALNKFACRAFLNKVKTNKTLSLNVNMC